MNTSKTILKTSLLFKHLLWTVFLLTLFRIIFYFVFHVEFEQSSLSDILHAFYIGFKFDLRLTVIIYLPLYISLFIVTVLAPKQESNFSKRTVFWSVFYSVINTFIFIFYLFDFGFYDYLHGRIDSSVLKFLATPKISFQMIWETYPVIWASLAILLFCLINYIVLRYVLFRQFHQVRINRLLIEERFKYKLGIFVLVFFTLAFSVYGKLSFYPLRWSDAYFNQQLTLSALASNPILFFVKSFKFKDHQIDEKTLRNFYTDLVNYLGIKDPDSQKLNFLRRIENVEPIVPGDPNIVVIILESMASFKTGLFGNPLNPTPHLDKLADSSLLFTRFYVPTIATARSVFTSITGLPDVSTIKTGSRNPFMVNQETIINQLSHHQKFYFLGGSASWGNIRGLLSHNIKNINIFEEGDYTSERTDVWGISDYHLLQEANKVFKKQKNPFFAIVQTAGFHRPYTIPTNIDDFKLASPSKSELEDAGFGSLAEYNSIRFEDFSLGTFLNQAKKENYYDNTIFIIYGDHGLPVTKAKHVNPMRARLGIDLYHVPLIMHAPKFFKPAQESKTASLVDILPTIAHIVGRPYAHRSLGRSLFDPQFDQNRFAFTYGWFSHPPQLGLMGDKFYYLKNSDGSETLSDIYSNDAQINYAQEKPELLIKMRNLCEALYRAGQYLLTHNPQLESDKKQKM